MRLSSVIGCLLAVAYPAQALAAMLLHSGSSVVSHDPTRSPSSVQLPGLCIFLFLNECSGYPGERNRLPSRNGTRRGRSLRHGGRAGCSVLAPAFCLVADTCAVPAAGQTSGHEARPPVHRNLLGPACPTGSFGHATIRTSQFSPALSLEGSLHHSEVTLDPRQETLQKWNRHHNGVLEKTSKQKWRGSNKRPGGSHLRPGSPTVTSL